MKCGVCEVCCVLCVVCAVRARATRSPHKAAHLEWHIRNLCDAAENEGRHSVGRVALVRVELDHGALRASNMDTHCVCVCVCVCVGAHCTNQQRGKQPRKEQQLTAFIIGLWFGSCFSLHEAKSSTSRHQQ